MSPTLDELRAEFGRSRLLSMPIAGAIAWTAAGVLGGLLTGDEARSYALFFCMPTVFPLALVIGRLIGEDVFGAAGRNELDQLFLASVLMANLVWAIAIPFWLIEPSSLPLSAGILSGLMWIPISWILRHWVGIFHAAARTVLVLLAWSLFPQQRFTIVPVVIVFVYIISIVGLATRVLPPARGNASDVDGR
jgi:hypothetical protein